MKTLFLVIAFGLSFFVASCSNVNTSNETEGKDGIIWQKVLGGSYAEQARSIKQTKDGGYVVAGYTQSNDKDVSGNHGESDYWIVKLDGDGRIVWKKALGGTADDDAYSIDQPNDGGYIVAGYSNSNDGDVSGNHGEYDAWVVKLDKDGNIEWQRSLGGSNSDGAFSVEQTEDGGYVMAGYTSSSDGDLSGDRNGEDFWIVKLDKNGEIVWQKAFEKYGDDEAHSVHQTKDGGYIVAGWSDVGEFDLHKNGDVYWIVKLDENGNAVWQKEFGGTSNDRAQSVQETDDGGYIVAGYTWSDIGDVSGNNGAWDYWVIKLDSDGNLMWQKPLGGSDYDYAYSVRQTADGGYVVAGYSRSSDKDVSGNHGGYDAWIVKLNDGGEIEWQKSLGGSNCDGAFSILQTNGGNYVMAGFSNSSDEDVNGNHGEYDYWIVKFTGK